MISKKNSKEPRITRTPEAEPSLGKLGQRGRELRVFRGKLKGFRGFIVAYRTPAFFRLGKFKKARKLPTFLYRLLALYPIGDYGRSKALIVLEETERPILTLALEVSRLVKIFRPSLEFDFLRKVEGGVVKFCGFRVLAGWVPPNCRKFLETTLISMITTHPQHYYNIEYGGIQ